MRANFIVLLELFIIALNVSATQTVLNYPYALYLAILIIINHSFSNGWSKYVTQISLKWTLPVLAFLMIDLFTKYIIKAGNYLNGEKAVE